MDGTTWNIALKLPAKKPVEPLVAQVIRHVDHVHPEAEWVIQDLEAIDPKGGKLGNEIDERGALVTTPAKLLDLLGNDGQVVELDVIVTHNQETFCRLIVVDGAHVMLVGKNALPPETAVGPYTELARGLHTFDS